MENTNKTNLKDFGFSCKIERTGDTVQLMCTVARFKVEHGEHRPYGIYGAGVDELTGLSVSTYLYSDRCEEGQIYLEYRDRSSYLKLEELEAMVKVLKKVEKGIAGFREEFGWERGIAQYLARASKVLGFGRMWIYREGKNDSYWEGYRNVGEGVDAVRNLITREHNRWAEAKEEKETAAAAAA